MVKEPEINSYQLSRNFFDWCFEHPDLIAPGHAAVFFFAVEHCNRLGWKPKFGFPTQMVMDAVGIKKHQTYIRFFNDLVTWGFFKLVQKSANQYSANIICLQNAMPKNGKALDKAIVKHRAKQIASIGQSTGQSKGSIDKPLTNKPLNQEQGNDYRSFAHLKISQKEFESLILEGWTKDQIDETIDAIQNYKKNVNYTSLFITASKWLKKDHKPGKIETALSISQLQDEEIKAKHAANDNR